jgi:probable addiction module antidote protein
MADPQEASNYLNAALEDSEEMFLVALRDVAEARQMAKVAESAGIAREPVYRMLTVEGNPTYGSLLGILRAVGLRMAIRPEETQGYRAASGMWFLKPNSMPQGAVQHSDQ